MKSINNNYLSCSISSDEMFTYVTLVWDDCIQVFTNCKLTLEFSHEGDVTGACYIGKNLYFTKDSNILYSYVMETKKIQEITFSEYDKIILYKKAAGYKEKYIVLRVQKDHFRDCIAYDLDSHQSLFSVLFDNFYDLAVINDNQAILLGEETKNIGIYEDDLLDKEYTLIKHLNYKNNEMIDNLSIIECEVDSFQNKIASQPSSIGHMKFPMDLFLMEYSDILSLSSYGKYIVYYNYRFNGFMIAESSGNLYRLFDSPFTRDNLDDIEKVRCYYNEHCETFTIVNQTGIFMYLIKQDSLAIEELNQIYNRYYEKKQPIHDQFTEFERIFYKCLFSGTHKLIGQINLD